MRRLSIPLYYLVGVVGPLFLIAGYLSYMVNQRWMGPPLCVLFIGIGILPLRQGRSLMAGNCWGGLLGALLGIGLGLATLVVLVVSAGRRPAEFAGAMAFLEAFAMGGLMAPVLATIGVLVARSTHASGGRKALLDAGILYIGILVSGSFAYRAHRREVEATRRFEDLDSAVRDGQTERVVALIAAEPGIVHRREYWGSALDTAVSRKDERMVKTLLDHGAQMDIYQAVQLGWVDVVSRILDQDPSLIHGSPTPAQHHSIFEAKPKPNGIRRTPLQAAVMAGRMDVVKLLLARGADPNAHASIPQPPLRLAVEAGEAGIARALLDAGADVNGAGSSGETSLFVIPWDRIDLAELLLAHGADPNAHMQDGQTVLTRAVGRSPELVELLLASGADPNLHFRGGETALDKAIRARSENRKRIVEALLARGADPRILDDFGHSPIDAARAQGDLEYVEMLEKANRTK